MRWLIKWAVILLDAFGSDTTRKHILYSRTYGMGDQKILRHFVRRWFS